MVKKICSGIGGILKIAFAVVAWNPFVPAWYENLSFYLLYSEGYVDAITLSQYLELCLMIAGLLGLIVSGLAQIYGVFRPNPLSKYSVLAMDIVMIVFGTATFLSIVGLVGEDDLIILFATFLPPILTALVDSMIILVRILKEKAKFFDAGNWLGFIRGLQIILIPIILCFTVVTTKAMIDVNVRRDIGNTALRGGFDTFSMQDMDGKEYTEELFHDHKITMINIWATYCHPCIEEMPELNEISQGYNPAQFQIIGIPADIWESGVFRQDKLELAQSVIEATGVTYPVLIPSPEIQFGVIDLAVYAVPHTIFFNEKGEQVYTVSGPRSKEEWVEIIEEVIANEA